MVIKKYQIKKTLEKDHKLILSNNINKNTTHLLNRTYISHSAIFNIGALFV